MATLRLLTLGAALAALAAPQTAAADACWTDGEITFLRQNRDDGNLMVSPVGTHHVEVEHSYSISCDRDDYKPCHSPYPQSIEDCVTVEVDKVEMARIGCNTSNAHRIDQLVECCEEGLEGVIRGGTCSSSCNLGGEAQVWNNDALQGVSNACAYYLGMPDATIDDNVGEGEWLEETIPAGAYPPPDWNPMEWDGTSPLPDGCVELYEWTKERSVYGQWETVEVSDRAGGIDNAVPTPDRWDVELCRNASECRIPPPGAFTHDQWHAIATWQEYYKRARTRKLIYCTNPEQIHPHEDVTVGICLATDQAILVEGMHTPTGNPPAGGTCHVPTTSPPPEDWFEDLRRLFNIVRQGYTEQECSDLHDAFAAECPRYGDGIRIQAHSMGAIATEFWGIPVTWQTGSTGGSADHVWRNNCDPVPYIWQIGMQASMGFMWFHDWIHVDGQSFVIDDDWGNPALEVTIGEWKNANGTKLSCSGIQGIQFEFLQDSCGALDGCARGLCKNNRCMAIDYGTQQYPNGNRHLTFPDQFFTGRGNVGSSCGGWGPTVGKNCNHYSWSHGQDNQCYRHNPLSFWRQAGTGNIIVDQVEHTLRMKEIIEDMRAVVVDHTNKNANYGYGQRTLINWGVPRLPNHSGAMPQVWQDYYMPDPCSMPGGCDYGGDDDGDYGGGPPPGGGYGGTTDGPVEQHRAGRGSGHGARLHRWRGGRRRGPAGPAHHDRAAGRGRRQPHRGGPAPVRRARRRRPPGAGARADHGGHVRRGDRLAVRTGPARAGRAGR